MLILDGEIPCDAAIFADTGWEPQAVYGHLEQLRALAAMRGFPIHLVQRGSIRDVAGQNRFRGAPFFMLNEDGTHGMSPRSCTGRLKIEPVRAKVRELMAERGLTIGGRPAVVQYLGISLDEIQRMKPSPVKFIEHAWPLIDRRWTRADCLRYLAEQGIDAPRSACIGCPYHSDREWRLLRDNAPDEFADAVAWEREVQAASGWKGTPFLHAARVPLDEVDLRSAEDRGQLNFDAECEGMCGV